MSVSVYVYGKSETIDGHCYHCDQPWVRDNAEELGCESVTYNVSGMYYAAMEAAGVADGLRGLHGMAPKDALVAAQKGLAYLDENYDALVAEFTPDNGWGSIKCVYRALHMVEWTCSMPAAVSIEVY